MKRIPEPELMLDAAQVRAYAEADFEAPHSHFMELHRADLPLCVEVVSDRHVIAWGNVV